MSGPREYDCSDMPGATEDQLPPSSSRCSAAIHCLESSEDILTVIYDQSGNAFTNGELCQYINHLLRENAKLRKAIDAGDTAIRQLEMAVKHRNDCRKCGGTGQEYRHWNQDYIDCMACDGRGH